jgi:hypothetical protein
MTRLLGAAAAAIFSFFLIAHPTVTTAQGAGDDGVMTTKVFKAIPKGAAITLEPEDDTDMNQRLRPVIARELRKQGYRVVDSAPIRFIYNADTPETRRARVTTRRSAERGSHLGRDPRERSGSMRYPLIRQDLNLTGQRLKEGETRHLVNAIVLQESGTQYWVGTALIDGRRGDSYAITARLAQVLTRQLGASVTGRKFGVN